MAPWVKWQGGGAQRAGVVCVVALTFASLAILAQAGEADTSAAVPPEATEAAGDAGAPQPVGWAWWLASIVGVLLLSLVLSILEYVALPWLLIPGALVDIPLRLAFFFLAGFYGDGWLSTFIIGSLGDLAGYGGLFFCLIPERVLQLLLRGIVVQILAAVISKVLVSTIGSMVCGLAAPFLKTLVAVKPAPLAGTLTVCLELNPDAIIRIAGFEHTSLVIERAYLEVVIWMTPFCPLWCAGCTVKCLEVEGGTYERANAIIDDCAQVYPDPEAPQEKQQPPFESLPAEWVCPCCEAPKALFHKYTNASGQVYWSHVKKRKCTQKLRVKVEGDAVVHTWAAAAVVVPGLPLLPNAHCPQLCVVKIPVVEVALEKVVDHYALAEQSAEREATVFSIGPILVQVPEATELLNPMELPMVKTVVASVEVKNMFCVFKQDDDHRTANPEDNVMWVGDHIDCGTEPEEKPFVLLNVNIVHAASVTVDGHICKLWTRTHFRALRMLATALMPVYDPPFAADHLIEEQDRKCAALRYATIDMRLRRLRDKLYTRGNQVLLSDLIETLQDDETLHELLAMVDEEVGHHAFAALAAAVANLKAEEERHHTMSDREVRLTELHLAFKGLETRVHEALDEIRKPNNGGELAREDIAHVLETNGFLRFLIDCSDAPELGNRVSWFPPWSWCDAIIPKILAGTGPMTRQEVWTMLCTVPEHPKEDDLEFSVEIRRQAEGLQEIFQGFIGGPVLATVKVQSSDTVKTLRECVAKEAGLHLSTFHLFTLDGIALDRDDATLAKYPPREAGSFFPGRLVVVQNSESVDKTTMGRVVRSFISININLDVGLPALVLSDRGMGNTEAELVLEMGHAVISMEKRDQLPGDEVNSRLMHIIHVVRDAGKLHDDEDFFFDTMKIKLYGTQFYMYRNVEQLMMTLDTDRDKLVTTAELCQSLFERNVVVTPEEIDANGDGEVTLDFLSAWLKINPSVAEVLCRSNIFINDSNNAKAAANAKDHDDGSVMELQFGMCFLPSQMLRNKLCAGFPQSRVRMALAPLLMTVDMWDLTLITKLSEGMMEGVNTIFVDTTSTYALHESAETATAIDLDGDGELGIQPVSDVVEEYTGPAYGSAAVKEIGSDGDSEQLNGLRAISTKRADGTTILKPVTPITEFEVQLIRLGITNTRDGRPSAVSIKFDITRSQVAIMSTTVQLRLDALRQTRGIMRLLAETRLYASCENEELGCWEPVLEPWTCAVLYENGDQDEGNDPRTRLEITAPSLMVVNVTYALLKDAMELLTLKSIDNSDPFCKNTTRCAHVAHSPYCLYNDTGLDVEFAIGSYKNNSEVEGGQRIVKRGEKVWLSPEHMNSSRIEAEALETLQRVILVRIPHDSSTTPVLIKNIRKVDVQKLEHRDFEGLLSTVHIEPTGHKVITLRSCIQIDNQTDAALEVWINRHVESFVVPSNTEASVPIDRALREDGDDVVRVRPILPGHEFKKSDYLLTKMDQMTAYNPPLQPLSVHSEGTGHTFHCHVAWKSSHDDEDGQAAQLPEQRKIVFLPFLVLKNQLPNAVRIGLSNSCSLVGHETGNHTEYDQLEAGQTRKVSCIGKWKRDDSVSLRLSLDAVDALFPPSQKVLIDAFRAMDLDLSGKLTRDEIARHWHAQGLHKIHQVFKHILNAVDEGHQEDKTLQALQNLLAEGDTDNDNALDVNEFVELFRFRQTSANRSMHNCHVVYHEGALKGRTKSGKFDPKSDMEHGDRVRVQAPNMRDAWKPSESWKAEPFQFSLEREIAGAKQSEGAISMCYEFSLFKGVPINLSMYCSHWIINQTELQLEAVGDVKNPIDGGIPRITLQAGFGTKVTEAHPTSANGYQLLGCGENPDMDLKLRIQGDETEFDCITPIGVPPYGPEDVKAAQSYASIALPISSYGPIRREVRVKVRAAGPPFIRTNVVTIAPTWLLRNTSSRTILLRVSAGQYESIGPPCKAQTHQGQDMDAVNIPQLERFDSVGKIKEHESFHGKTAICFHRVINSQTVAVWLPKYDRKGKKLLRRVDKSVIGHFKVTHDVPIWRNLGALGLGVVSHLGDKYSQPLPAGSVIAVTRVRLYKKGRYCAKFQIPPDLGNLPAGSSAWIKFASEHGYGGMGAVVPLSRGGGEWAYRKEFEEIFDHTYTQKQENGRDTVVYSDKRDGVIELQPGGVLPLTLWESQSSHQYIRIALPPREKQATVWSEQFALEYDEHSVKQSCFKLAETLDGQKKPLFVEAFAPEKGTLIIRDPRGAPFVIRNTTNHDLEYRVTPHSRPWWKKLPKNSKREIHGVISLSKSGKVGHKESIKGRVDQRRLTPAKEYPKVYLRVVGDPDTEFLTSFEFDKPRRKWSVVDQSLDPPLNVETATSGESRLIQVSTAGTSLVEKIPRLCRTEFRMQGVCCSFVDQCQAEWARFELDHLHMTTCAIGLLHVSVIEAENFKSADFLGDNDHYVKLSLVGEEFFTSTITSKHPVWISQEKGNLHDEFANGSDFQTSFAARLTDNLCVEVFDRDVVGADDLLGSLKINIKYQVLSRKARSFTDWFDMEPYDKKGVPAGRLKLCFKFEKEMDHTPVMMEFNMGRFLFAARDQTFGQNGLINAMIKAKQASSQGVKAILRGTAAIVSAGMTEMMREDGGVLGGARQAKSPKSNLPDKAVFAIDQGIHFVQKWMTAKQQIVKAMLLEFSQDDDFTGKDTGAIQVNINDSFIRGALDLGASLIGPEITDPLIGPDQGRTAAVNALRLLAETDRHVVPEWMYDEGASTICEKPGVLRIAGFTTVLGISIDNFIAGLLDDRSARKLAMAAGIDLVGTIHGPTFATTMIIVRQFVEFELGIKFDELSLPKTDTILTALDSSNEIFNYIMIVVWKVVRHLLPWSMGVGTLYRYLQNAVAPGITETKKHEQKNRQPFGKPGRHFNPDTKALQSFDRSWMIEWEAQAFTNVESLLLISTSRPLPQLIYHSAVSRSLMETGNMLVLPVLYDDLWDSPKMILGRVRELLAAVQSTTSATRSTKPSKTSLRSISVMSIADRHVPHQHQHQHQHVQPGGVSAPTTFHSCVERSTMSAVAIGNLRSCDVRMQPAHYIKFWQGLCSLLSKGGRLDLFLCEGVSEKAMRSYVLGIPVMGRAQHALLTDAAEDLRARVGSNIRVGVVPRVADVDRDVLTQEAAVLCDPRSFYLWAAGTFHAATDLAKSMHEGGRSGGAVCTGLLRRDLAKSGRKRKGMFECAGQSTRWKTYNFVLQHDGRLSWSEYTSPRDSQSGGGGGACASSPSKHFEEDIEEMTWDLADGGRLMPAYPNDKPSEFRIESNGKGLHLQADTVEDRNRWCKAISTEVARQTKQGSPLKGNGGDSIRIVRENARNSKPGFEA